MEFALALQAFHPAPISGLPGILIVLVVIGVCLWLLQLYVMPKVAEPIRTIIYIVIALAVIVWLLRSFGMV